MLLTTMGWRGHPWAVSVPVTLTGAALLSLLGAAGRRLVGPAERPAPCHPVHRPGLWLSRTNTEGETTEPPPTGTGKGTRDKVCGKGRARADHAEGSAAGCVRRQMDVSVELL